MNTKVFDHDILTRQTVNWHTDSDGNVVIESVQDVAPVVELSRAEFNSFDERTPWKGDFHKVGSIPIVVWDDLVRRGIANDDAALRRWLDDSDNRAFRTRPGRLS